MPKRSKEWDETLQKELKKPKFAKAFIEACLHEGIPIHIALGRVIRAMGVVEYADRVGIAPSNLHRILRSRANPTLDTLQTLLAPLGLKLGVVESGKSRRKAA